MFHYDGGLKLTRADLAIDFRRRQPRAFVSHAHFDHMARHALALATPETAKFYQLRLGRRETLELPYRKTIDWGGMKLTTYPAGHCLGSAMLLAEVDGRSLLYTGDFKLDPSATAETAELPRADVLVMESTFGEPKYRFPPREQSIERLYEAVEQSLDEGRLPVVEAYVLGKAQEATALLARRGIAVRQHPEMLAISRAYQECGVDLGLIEPFSEDDWNDSSPPDFAVVAPPGWGRRAKLRRERIARIAISGWAIDPHWRFRQGLDHAIPLSDHADYDQLFEAVACVNPREIYCTHGPASFVDRLAEQGWQAFPLGRAAQLRLF